MVTGWQRGVAAAAGIAALAGALLAAFFLVGTSQPSAPAQGDRQLALLDGLIEASGEGGFERPDASRGLAFPADHGAHPGARAESWTLAAHLETGDGETVGVQLALTRFGIRAPGAAAARSVWSIDALHRGHLVVEDAKAGFHAEERYSRGALGSAGHDVAAPRVWLDDWSLSADGDAMRLEARADGEPVSLRLSPEKPALPSGDGEAAPRRALHPR